MKKACFIKRSKLYILPLLILVFNGCNDNDDTPPGHITGNTTWSGTVTITGDVIVEEGVTLTIEPGTTITITADQDDTGLSHLGEVDDLTTSDPTADPDAGGLEYQQSHISIIINGTIISRGTSDAPIKFCSSNPDPFYTDWTGITANNGVFEYTIIEWCLDGLYSLDNFEKLTVDHCLVRHVWAAGIGFNRPLNSGVEAYIKNTTIEDCGHEAIDTHSPGIIELAYNVIRDSQVGINLHDDMNANIHHNIIVNTTFPFICVNSTDVFITQCILQASIQDNTRWTYQGWTMPLFEDPAAIFISNSTATSVIVTNSIILDSPVGFKNEAPQEALANGYINMDNVDEPYALNSIQGAGCLEVESGFVNQAGGDFHLLDTSPLKNAGNPEDGSPDLGAYGGVEAQEDIGCNM